MAMITTDRPINHEQLAYELGSPENLRVREYPENHPDPDLAGRWRVSADELDEATLEAGVEAHDADPEWTSPIPPTPLPLPADGVRATLDAVKGYYTLEEAAATCRFTAEQLVAEALAWAAAVEIENS